MGELGRRLIGATARAVALVGLALPAAAAHMTGHTLWTTTGSDRCAQCHGATPVAPQLNAAGTSSTVASSTVINYVRPGMSCAYANGLTATQLADISKYIATIVPDWNTNFLTTPINTARTVNVGVAAGNTNGHITLATSFNNVRTVSNPVDTTTLAATGSLNHVSGANWGGTSVIYTPPSNYVGYVSFSYRGVQTVDTINGDARTVRIKVGSVPAITSSSTWSGTVGVVMSSYTITATNAPTSFGWTGGISGLSRSGAVISGTPAAATNPTLATTISATNNLGTDNNTLTFTIAKGNPTLTFNAQTPTPVYSLGGTFAVSPVATFSPALADTQLNPIYDSLTTGVCTTPGTTSTLVTIVTAGTCTLRPRFDGNANWNAAPTATSRNVIISKANQTLTFGAQTTPINYVNGGTFGIVAATSSAGNPAPSGINIVYGTTTPTVCGVSGTTGSFISAGTCIVTANEDGNTNYNAAPQITTNIVINAVSPPAPTIGVPAAGDTEATINFTAPSNGGGSTITGYTATCTASGQTTRTGTNTVSPIVVTSMVNSVQYTCSVKTNTSAFPSGGSSSGTVFVTPSATPVAPAFTSANNTTFTVGTAGNFSVTASGPPAPTITRSGALPTGVTFTDGTTPRALSGTPASGQAGTYPLTFTAANGTLPNATQNFTLTIAKRAQSINFGAPADRVYSPTAFAISATSVDSVTSAATGLVVAFASQTPSVCSVSGSNVTMLDVGQCTIRASQAGGTDYLAAANVDKSFQISQATQSITFNAQLTASRAIVPGGTFALNPAASASSGLAIAYSTSTPTVCTYASGVNVTMNAVGTCTIVASQGGDSRYAAAGDAQQSVSITISSQSINFPVQAQQGFSPGGTFQINPPATASSGLPVAYSDADAAICTVSGSTVTMVAVGTCRIAADQAGDNNFTPAAQVVGTIAIVAVAPDAPTIGAATPGNGQASIAFDAPANDGGSPITGYVATCNPGGKTGTNSISPVVVSTLTNGTSYSCSVQAINAVGPGAASATVSVTPSSQGPALWASHCQGCHGSIPSGARFNAAGTSTAVLSYVIANNPAMNIPVLNALTESEKSDLVAHITSYLAPINDATRPDTPKVLTVGSHLTLNTFSFTDVVVTSPPAHGTLSSFNGVEVTYTPNGGYTGADSFSYRGNRSSPTALAGDPRTVSIVIGNAAKLLGVSKNGAGTGTILSVDPTSGINCGSSFGCNEAYVAGTSVILVATPDPGSSFTGWGGACSGNGGCFVTMDADKTVSATFGVPAHTLTVNRLGAGFGTVTSAPTGIDCGATCAGGFDDGVQVTLDQTASPGSVFVGWSGACSGSGGCTVTMDASKSVTATFALAFTLDVAIAGAGSGSVSSSPPGISCSSTCSGDFVAGTIVGLTATPSAGSAFAGWSGDCTGTGACNVTMSAARSVTATFVPTFTLTVSNVGSGGGTVTSTPAGINCGATCSADYATGTMVGLTPTPAGGSTFVGWSGACTGSGGCLVTMDAAKGVTATFNLQGAGSPGISLSPPSLDFGGQSMATTSPSQSITVTNTGNAALSIGNISLNSPQFTQTNNCTTVVPSASCTINVSFAPMVAGGALNSTATVTSTLFISSNAPGTPHQAGLQGVAEKSLVTHYYRSILRRAPDAPGKAFWASEATRMSGLGANVNEVWFAMSGFFYFSSEYTAFNRNDTEYVTDLYNTFFNRGPDGPGLSFWGGQLAQGMPREVVLAAFMFSNEFTTFAQNIFGNTAARAEVDVVGDFYRGLLARLPDDGGFNFWVGQFRTAQCQGAGPVYTTVESISSGFANGGEYFGRGRTNPQYIGDLYNSFLRRGGDLGGVQFWINQLNTSAMTRDFVRQQFIASGEFNGRVNAIINQGCMP